MSETQQFTTFFLRGLYFGIDVRKVQEVIRCQPLTRVPTAPAVVCGLINLRGQIVTALDLRQRLAPDSDTGDVAPNPINVIVRGEDGVVSLLVDEIGDVIEVSDDLFESPPETLQGVARDLIRGAYKLEDRLLLVLDVDLTVGAWAETVPHSAAQGIPR